MRNRALHDALREFALEAAALLLEDQKSGAELEFDVAEERQRRGPALYRYRPLTERFIEERWPGLRGLPTCARAAEELGAGAAQYLRLNGLRGEQAEPALHAMLERLYEDATSFGFPEERFDRVYAEVERTLYRDAVPATILAPLPGLDLEPSRIELGNGLALVRGDTMDAPAEAVWPDGAEYPAALCLLERLVSPDDPLPAEEACVRFRELLSGLRLYKAGGVALGPLGWQRTAGGRWAPLELASGGTPWAEPMAIAVDEEPELVEFLETIAQTATAGTIAWALERFEMGCSRDRDSDALSDYLLSLRALLDVPSESGQASLALRLAALCAEEGERRTVQRRIELAVALERFHMSGGPGGELQDVIGVESPLLLVHEVERHLRALLRDVMCGYLEPDLKGVADEMLLERPEPSEIRIRDLRSEPVEPSTDELEAVHPPPARTRRPAEWRPMEPNGGPEGVTPSADFADEDPGSYSAPV